MVWDLVASASATASETSPQLSDAECFELAKSLSHVQGGWIAQRDDDDGDVSMLLSSDDPGFYVRAMFIERDHGGYRVSLDCGSGLVPAGTINDFSAVMNLVRFVMAEIAHHLPDELMQWLRLADFLKDTCCKAGAIHVLSLCYILGDSVVERLN